jgi:hypothetical protein
MTAGEASRGGCDRHARLRLEYRQHRLEKRYRRLLALYPQDHRREHAEEMVGVLLTAAAADARYRDGSPATRILQAGQHAADCTDLIAGACRIRARVALNQIRKSRWFAATVRDPRWSDALAIVSVVAPLLLLVAALAEFGIPQATAGGLTGHPSWALDNLRYSWDLPLTIGAPAVAILAALRLRRIAGIAALATGISRIVVGAVTSVSGVASPAIALTILLAGTAGAALLLSPGPARGVALLTWRGTTLVAAGALVLGGFSVGSNMLLGYPLIPSSDYTAFHSEVAGLPADLLIASVLAIVAVACLRTAVTRRVLALLAIPVIPYAILWQEKLASDLVGPFGAASTLIPSSAALLYLPPLMLACLIVTGTRLARRRATGRARQAGAPASSAGPPGVLRA